MWFLFCRKGNTCFLINMSNTSTRYNTLKQKCLWSVSVCSLWNWSHKTCEKAGQKAITVFLSNVDSCKMIPHMHLYFGNPSNRGKKEERKTEIFKMQWLLGKTICSMCRWSNKANWGALEGVERVQGGAGCMCAGAYRAFEILKGIHLYGDKKISEEVLLFFISCELYFPSWGPSVAPFRAELFLHFSH